MTNNAARYQTGADPVNSNSRAAPAPGGLGPRSQVILESGERRKEVRARPADPAVRDTGTFPRVGHRGSDVIEGEGSRKGHRRDHEVDPLPCPAKAARLAVRTVSNFHQFC